MPKLWARPAHGVLILGRGGGMGGWGGSPWPYARSASGMAKQSVRCVLPSVRVSMCCGNVLLTNIVEIHLWLDLQTC